MSLKVFGSRFVATYLHNSKLIPLPNCLVSDISSFVESGLFLRSRFVDRTKDMCTPRLR
jgi:hypothetical protein